jgi:class 3 adenylate cyclase
LAYVAAVKKAAESNGGRVFKTAGDGTFSEFGSTIEATRAALQIQDAVVQQNMGATLRMGLSVGDVVIEGDDVLRAQSVQVESAGRIVPGATPSTHTPEARSGFCP